MLLLLLLFSLLLAWFSPGWSWAHSLSEALQVLLLLALLMLLVLLLPTAPVEPVHTRTRLCKQQLPRRNH